MSSLLPNTLIGSLPPLENNIKKREEKKNVSTDKDVYEPYPRLALGLEVMENLLIFSLLFSSSPLGVIL